MHLITGRVKPSACSADGELVRLQAEQVQRLEEVTADVVGSERQLQQQVRHLWRCAVYTPHVAVAVAVACGCSADYLFVVQCKSESGQRNGAASAAPSLAPRHAAASAHRTLHKALPYRTTPCCCFRLCGRLRC